MLQNVAENDTFELLVREWPFHRFNVSNRDVIHIGHRSFRYGTVQFDTECSHCTLLLKVSKSISCTASDLQYSFWNGIQH